MVYIHTSRFINVCQTSVFRFSPRTDLRRQAPILPAREIDPRSRDGGLEMFDFAVPGIGRIPSVPERS